MSIQDIWVELELDKAQQYLAKRVAILEKSAVLRSNNLLEMLTWPWGQT